MFYRALGLNLTTINKFNVYESVKGCRGGEPFQGVMDAKMSLPMTGKGEASDASATRNLL